MRKNHLGMRWFFVSKNPFLLSLNPGATVKRGKKGRERLAKQKEPSVFARFKVEMKKLLKLLAAVWELV